MLWQAQWHAMRSFTREKTAAQQGLSRRIVRRNSGGHIADYRRGLDAGGVRPPLTAAGAVTVRMPAGAPWEFPLAMTVPPDQPGFAPGAQGDGVHLGDAA